MRKVFLSLVAATMGIGAIHAQTILSEDFETGNTQTYARPVTKGTGWTTIDTAKYDDPESPGNFVWSNHYYVTAEGEPLISGLGCAHVGGAIVESMTGGHGPREEVLLSPELNLNDTYQLSFSFIVSPMNCQTDSEYDFQVRVVEGNGSIDQAPVVFTIQDADVLRNCGIPGGFIKDWAVRDAKVDLSSFKGKNVKLAFVYKMNRKLGNSLFLDDIKVAKFTPATAPVAKIDINRVSFPKIYIGEKIYSDIITLTNEGLDGLKITSIDYPEGLGSTLNPAKVNVLRGESVPFRLSYTASLASVAGGDVVFHTNGGDFTVSFTAQKEFLPDDVNLETFEGYNPPAGWTSKGWTASPFRPIEGDKSMMCDGDYSKSILTTPRLDLTDGGTLKFSYLCEFVYDDAAAYDPALDVTVSVSYDGGANWKTIWTAPYSDEYMNKLLDVTLDLGSGSDNSYVRWEYPAVESDDDGVVEHYTFYLDRVMLPTIFGSDGVPGVAGNPTPAAMSQNIYPRNVTLSWTPAQFATGYKLYIGTSSACNEFVDGQDMGNKLSTVIPVLDYETRYLWKVVPYNDKGDATGVSTWSFTTQPDATIKEFPYVEDFVDAVKNDGALPIGWETDDSNCAYAGFRKWALNRYSTYVDANKDSFYILYAPSIDPNESNSVTTPTVVLPNDKSMEVTFVWGDTRNYDLITDNTGLVEKKNAEPNNGVVLVEFQIGVNDTWTTLSTLSQNPDSSGRKYWIAERIDLSNYAGQEVRFRWVHHSFSTKNNGCCVARITIEEAKGDKAAFNKKGWNAGKVNYGKSTVSTEQFTLFNQGSNPQIVKRVAFANPNFESTLKAGDEIPAGGAITFGLSFKALDSERMIEDAMAVTFESGLIVEFPVSGDALSKETTYFSFEPNDDELFWEDHFSTIDVDNAYNFAFEPSTRIYYSANGSKSAFTLESDEGNGKGLWGNMSPVSGMYALVAASPENTHADNWLVTRRLQATADSKFEFYVRSRDCLEDFYPYPLQSIEVLVSTADGSDHKTFETLLPGHELAYLTNGAWHHYEVDCSKYAGQNVHIALRHYTDEPSSLIFVDDISLHHFKEPEISKDNLEMITACTRVEVFTVSGFKVAQGNVSEVLSTLPQGVYIVKYENGKAIRICK